MFIYWNWATSLEWKREKNEKWVKTEWSRKNIRQETEEKTEDDQERHGEIKRIKY